MALALLSKLAWERRTSFGAPVEPDVLSNRASSGWSERDAVTARRRSSQPVTPGLDGRADVPRRAERRSVGASEQGHVSAGQEPEVGHHELDRVRALHGDERAGGQLELLNATVDPRRQLGVRGRASVLDEGDGVRYAGTEETLGDPFSGQYAHRGTVREASQSMQTTQHTTRLTASPTESEPDLRSPLTAGVAGASLGRCSRIGEAKPSIVAECRVCGPGWVIMHNGDGHGARHQLTRLPMS